MLLRKIASLLLLALLSFNWFGYRLFISFFENEANEQFETKLDNNNYENNQLISIKVPVTNLAYYTNSKLFERVDGQVEINGVLCNYVKQRLYNDSLELLCIPNAAAMKLQTEKNDLVKSVNDIQQTDQTKKTSSHPVNNKNFSLDHFTIQDIFNLDDLFANAANKSFHFSSSTSFPYCAAIENPPEHSSVI
jgi:hypothetical protein